MGVTWPIASGVIPRISDLPLLMAPPASWMIFPIGLASYNNLSFPFSLPMGKIIHEAGGAISNGRSDILGITPDAISQVTPIYIGGKKEIRLIEKYMTEGG